MAGERVKNLIKKIPGKEVGVRFGLAVAVIYSLALLFFTKNELSVRYLSLILAIPFALFTLFSFETSLFIFVSLLFLNANFYYFSTTEVFVPILFFASLLIPGIRIADFKNPLIKPLAVYFICILPSFLTSVSYPETWLLTYNFVAFLMTIAAITFGIRSIKKIHVVLMLFVALATLNGLHVILESYLTNKRAFGFAGIMFVDYVSVASIVVYNQILSQTKKRFAYSVILGILLLSLILTQTRSIWIIAFLTLGGITIQALFVTKTFTVKRTHLIIGIIIFSLFLAFYGTQYAKSNKNFAERFKSEKVSDTDDPSRLVISFNSLVTRFFIWSTAKNAFLAHPINGIGLYSFPFVSKNYSSLPPFIYELFVKKLTPHETFIAVITETGIIGLIGFLYLLTQILAFANKMRLKNLQSPQSIGLSGTIFWLNIYVILSMVITDAWLSANGIMLWGFIIGLTIANYKIIELEKPYVEYHLSATTKD